MNGAFTLAAIGELIWGTIPAVEHAETKKAISHQVMALGGGTLCSTISASVSRSASKNYKSLINFILDPKQLMFNGVSSMVFPANYSGCIPVDLAEPAFDH